MKPRSKLGDRRLNEHGYACVFVGSQHHLANSRGWALEHRLVMERKLGRPLRITEIVHHVDGNRTNNSEENLVACGRDEHRVLHRLMRIERYATPEALGVTAVVVRKSKTETAVSVGKLKRIARQGLAGV